MVFTLKSSQILQFSVLFGVSIAIRVSGTTVCRIIANRRLIFVTAHIDFEIWVRKKNDVPGYHYYSVVLPKLGEKRKIEIM